MKVIKNMNTLAILSFSQFSRTVPFCYPATKVVTWKNPVTIIFNKMLKVTEVCMYIKNSRFPKKLSKEKGLCTCPPYGLSVTWGVSIIAQNWMTISERCFFGGIPSQYFYTTPAPQGIWLTVLSWGLLWGKERWELWDAQELPPTESRNEWAIRAVMKHLPEDNNNGCL